MKTLLLGIVLGFSLKFFGIEYSNYIQEVRWEDCIAKVNAHVNPETLPSGQQYCMGTVWSDKSVTMLEILFQYQPNYWRQRQAEWMKR